MEQVINDVKAELARIGDMTEFDRNNTRNDWISYINAYTGRAAEKVFRNQKEEQDFRRNMVKAAGLAISAIVAHDKGYC